MTQKTSSKEPEIKVEEEPEIEVKVEGEEPTPVQEPEAKEPEKKEPEEDVEALRKQIADLKSAQELSRTQAMEADRRAQETYAQINNLRQSAQQSQYDSIVTAMGAAQIEVDSAKRDIMLAGAAQDYSALADAQERLSAAKSHMVSLEQGKNNYEAMQQQQPQQQSNIPQLLPDEANWLQAHPEVISDPRKNAKLNAAYFDAMDKGLSRGSRDYFNFIEEQLGYRQPQVEQQKPPQQEESSVMVAAPPSKNVPSGSGAGGRKTSFTLSKEEAEIARLSGISPADYVKQREILREQKRIHPGDYPER